MVLKNRKFYVTLFNSTVSNDLKQCINSFKRMKRGGIGIADELIQQTCENAVRYIDKLESYIENSDVAPVKHGHWESSSDKNCKPYAYCSACKQIMNPILYGYAYCGMCGARMDDDRKE